MVGYNGTYQDFTNQLIKGTLVDSIIEQMRNQHISFSDGDVRSWNNSIVQLHLALSNISFDKNVEVAIEYRVPLTSKRVDFLIAGKDINDKDQILIIELKQWEKCCSTDKEGVVITSFQGNQNCETAHPSWQAYGYSSVISHYNEEVEKLSIELHPCAFLHNYNPIYVSELKKHFYNEGLEKAPCFIKTEYDALAKFVQKYISKAPRTGILYTIENGKIRPSKMLQNALASMIKGNHEFDLIDEQQVAYANIAKVINYPSITDKNVIIVEGGAGTGKSLIALQLMCNQISHGRICFYVTKNVTPRENYKNLLKKEKFTLAYIDNLFKSSGAFINSTGNELDCLIIDEAHRLTEKSKMSWMYYGNNQIKEMINAAKTTIFFIDEKQQITLQDYGSVANIVEQANQLKAKIHRGVNFNLSSQFRCNGSDEYIAWLDNILYGKELILTEIKVDYDIQIFDDINEMVKKIQSKNVNNKARILSGDVFPWLSRTDSTKIDININGFSAQWNKTNSFATDVKSFNEVGCIHTAQGMEFEYVGLIIGDDLRYENNKIITDYTKHPSGAAEFKRPHQRNVKIEDIEKIDLLIRNTYRILLNRGQKGCYIYCMDSKLGSYLKEKIKLIQK